MTASSCAARRAAASARGGGERRVGGGRRRGCAPGLTRARAQRDPAPAAIGAHRRRSARDALGAAPPSRRSGSPRSARRSMRSGGALRTLAAASPRGAPRGRGGRRRRRARGRLCRSERREGTAARIGSTGLRTSRRRTARRRVTRRRIAGRAAISSTRARRCRRAFERGRCIHSPSRSSTRCAPRAPPADDSAHRASVDGAARHVTITDPGRAATIAARRVR